VTLQKTVFEDRVLFECSGYKPLGVTKQQYQACLTRYAKETTTQAEMDVRIYTMILRYNCIGVNNNHCSIPPDVIRFSNAHTELFGSPFNTTLDQYCSPFPDIESYFGSVGSFFDFDFTAGTYVMNPPYDEQLMYEAMEVATAALNTKTEITIIVVIPIWSTEQQEESHGEVYFDKEFKARERLLTCPYLRTHVTLKRDEHRFYDYFTSRYIGVCDVHLAILSNTTYQLTAAELADYWKSHC
jgi:hypothetical protein